MRKRCGECTRKLGACVVLATKLPCKHETLQHRSTSRAYWVNVNLTRRNKKISFTIGFVSTTTHEPKVEPLYLIYIRLFFMGMLWFTLFNVMISDRILKARYTYYFNGTVTQLWLFLHSIWYLWSKEKQLTIIIISYEFNTLSISTLRGESLH